MKPINYLLRKRFTAYLFGSMLIVLLYFLREFGDIDTQFTLDTMATLERLDIAFMGTQSVSDVVREFRSNN